MFYLITIAAATVLIALVNFLLDGASSFLLLGEHLLRTVLGVVAVFAIDGIFAFLIRRLPERWFLPEAKLFFVGKGEKNFYRKTKINTWKQYVPEWGCFTGFHKDKVREPDSSAYIGRFLIESNYGVAGHIAGAFLGFLIMLLPFLRPFAIALPLAVVNWVLGILPTMILRSNTPSLPISPSLVTSIISPSMGVKSSLKSPE
jgi:hypothetical protein